MPDDEGVLTPEERLKANAWFNTWLLGKPCPVSNDVNWSLADHVVTPIVYSAIGRSAAYAAPAYPQVMFICNSCGYVHYVSAPLAGITSVLGA